MTDSLLIPGEDNTPLIDPDKNYLDEFIGEGGKFHNSNKDEAIKALARGKKESDLYINTLTARLDEMRSDYTRLREDNVARAKLEELIDQFKNNQQLASSEENHRAKEVTEQPPYDPKQIESLVSSKIQEHEVRSKEKANFDTVLGKLQEAHGNNYHSFLQQKMKTLGITENEVNNLARRSPEAFYSMMGMSGQNQKQESFQTPPNNSQRSDNFSPTTKKRTWSYYQNMKKSDPRLYNDPKTIVQMHDDYITLGDEFEDGDFSSVR